MRFDCGETAAEEAVRRWKWQRWFAWHPVKITAHDCRWLEVVERRSYFAESYWAWEYRPAA